MEISTATREMLLETFDEERQHQEEKWGNQFDDKNTINDWVTYITSYASKAGMTGVPVEQESALRKAGALCLAALEALERNKKFQDRHYDNG